MGLLDKFERRLEKAVRKPFGGRGGDLQPVELASALRNSVDRSIVLRGERSIAPNDAAFRFGEASYEKAYEWGSPLAEELCDVIIRHARTQGYTLPADVTVKFVKDPSLPEHEFEVDTAFSDADGQALHLSEGADSPAHAPQDAAPQASAARWIDEPEPEPDLMGVLTVEGQRYAIEGSSVVIGRSSSADIAVADSGVSRRHVEILNRGGVFTVRDLGSTNGSFLNGTALDGEYELTDGSLITMSQTRISFRLIERPHDPRPSSPSRFEPDSPEAYS